jgi:hypothetical protein
MHFHRLAAIAVLTSTAYAGNESSATAPVEAPVKSIFSGDLTLTIANQYNTRGLIIQDDGVTFQPALNLYANVHKGEGFINSASLILGLWSDVSTETDVSAPGDAGHFTEFDYGLGFTFNFAKRWSFTSFYNLWTSPADGYGDGSWINATIAYDDTGLLGENFSLKPYLIVLRDLGGEAGTGLEKNSWYFEPGIRPNYTFFSGSSTPVNLGLLIKAGLGEKFYAGETYGYLAAGPQVSVPLGFIDPSAGKWTVSAGYLVYDFGSTLEAFNGRSHDHLATVSLSVSF